jgi:hypothetical protein
MNWFFGKNEKADTHEKNQAETEEFMANHLQLTLLSDLGYNPFDTNTIRRRDVLLKMYFCYDDELDPIVALFVLYNSKKNLPGKNKKMLKIIKEDWNWLHDLDTERKGAYNTEKSSPKRRKSLKKSSPKRRKSLKKSSPKRKKSPKKSSPKRRKSPKRKKSPKKSSPKRRKSAKKSR